MRGIIASGAYIPHRRLDRSEIAGVFGKGGGRGTRSVASYDEDTTTMGAEAARNALRDAGSVADSIDTLWFATSTPAYLEKTNAAAIHAALRLDPSVGALDLGGALRSGIGTLRTALQGAGTTMVVAADIRDGMATSADEANGGDGAAALVIGDDAVGPVIAEYVGAGVATGLAAAPTDGRALRARVLGPTTPPVAGTADVAAAVRTELANSPRTWHLPQPAVRVADGRVELRGAIPHEEARLDLVRTAGAVHGVRAVDDQLVVRATDIPG